MTSMTAPHRIAPIMIPFVFKDYFNLPNFVNSPESSYSWTIGRMSQQMKKFKS